MTEAEGGQVLVPLPPKVQQFGYRIPVWTWLVLGGIAFGTFVETYGVGLYFVLLTAIAFHLGGLTLKWRISSTQIERGRQFQSSQIILPQDIKSLKTSRNSRQWTLELNEGEVLVPLFFAPKINHAILKHLNREQLGPSFRREPSSTPLQGGREYQTGETEYMVILCLLCLLVLVSIGILDYGRSTSESWGVSMGAALLMTGFVGETIRRWIWPALRTCKTTVSFNEEGVIVKDSLKVRKHLQWKDLRLVQLIQTPSLGDDYLPNSVDLYTDHDTYTYTMSHPHFQEFLNVVLTYAPEDVVFLGFETPPKPKYVRY